MRPEGILVRWITKAFEVDLYESKLSMGIHCCAKKKKDSKNSKYKLKVFKNTTCGSYYLLNPSAEKPLEIASLIAFPCCEAMLQKD